MADDVIKHSVHTLVFRSLKRSHDMFLANQGMLPPIDEKAEKILRSVKARDSYGQVMAAVQKAQALKQQEVMNRPETPHDTDMAESAALGSDGAMLPYTGPSPSPAPAATALAPRKPPTMPKPKWHAPWKLFRVISGHLGWVRCVAVEPGNEWFATGAADRVIKIWDLASGKLKVSLTGHVSTVRGLEVSARHPYLFSCGEDRQVKCWDLEYNKVIRHYHGHLSAVYTLAQHPSIDVLVTAGRDATARVWDMRTKANVHTLTGHTDTIASLQCQAGEPQIITGSHDSTIRLWDLAAGKSLCTLTNHKKSVRSIVIHPTLYTFASASPDNIKQWKCPEGKFIQNLSGHNAIVNCMAVNPEGVLVSGGDNGTMYCWDWRTGHNFQRLQANVHTLTGHTDTIASLQCQAGEPQIITGSHDSTIRLWDLAAGKSLCTLTNHKKSVRSIVIHPTLYTFASASPDNIKQWKCPEGKFIQNLSGHNAIVNCMAVNPEGVLVSGGDNGTMYCWDWRTGHNFQRLQSAVQPGSMDSEAGIFAMTFDRSGARLITAEADKSIKIYREDDAASEETHPINWRPEILKRRKF